MIERVKQAASAIQITTAFSVVNAGFNAVMFIVTIAAVYWGLRMADQDQVSRISSIEKIIEQRAGDHDRIIEMGADIKWLRAVVERRAENVVPGGRLPHP